MSDSKKLKINASCCSNDLIILAACFFAIRLKTVRNESSALINIYMVKEVCVHEITVALVVVAGKTLVLVQVHACYL